MSETAQTMQFSISESASKPKSERDLVIQACKGDTQAFNELVDRYFSQVYAVAYARLGAREAAEDLVQETFLRVYLNLDKLRNPAQFAPWLMRIARNLSASWIVKGERSSRLLPMVPVENERLNAMPDDSADDAREKALCEEHRCILANAIAKLTPEEREVVLLHFSDDLSKSEIARRLGVHPSTVGRQIENVLHSLRDMIQPAMETAIRSAAKPRPVLKWRTMAVIGATAALSASSRSALASAAELSMMSTEVSTAKTGIVASVPVLLKSISATLAAGASTVGTAKITVAAVALIAGGTYFYNHSGPAGSTDTQAPAVAVASAPNVPTLIREQKYKYGGDQLITIPKGEAVRCIVEQSPYGVPFQMELFARRDGNVEMTTRGIPGVPETPVLIGPDQVVDSATPGHLETMTMDTNRQLFTVASIHVRDLGASLKVDCFSASNPSALQDAAGCWGRWQGGQISKVQRNAELLQVLGNAGMIPQEPENRRLFVEKIKNLEN